MKNYILIIASVLLFSACAKQEEVVLNKALDAKKDYFYTEESRNFSYESAQNLDDNQYLYVDYAFDYSNYVSMGTVTLDDSYIYGGLGGNYDSYNEEIEAKKDVSDNVKFQITEQHNNVYSSYYSYYSYQVNFSPYELHLLKPGLILGQSWSTVQDITLSYKPQYSSDPVIADKVVTGTFHFEVLENGGSRMINDIYYDDLLKISVNYSFGEGVNYYRTYTFANGIGLVSYSLQVQNFLLF